MNNLVTGKLAGANATSYDIDGGVTTIRSPEITLPIADSLILSFRYYLAHGSNSAPDDYLRVKVVGSTTMTVFEEMGAAINDDSVWEINNVSIDGFTGETVYLLIVAADEGSESLVEAAIDDVLIVANGLNQTPTADPQSLSTPEDTPIDIVLTGSDPDGDPLTFAIVLTPTHAILDGTPPNLTYTPLLNYNGVDSFTFLVNDGHVNSEPTTVDIEVMPVNDTPIADPQSLSTPEDISLNIILTGSDPDIDPLSFTVVSTPTDGILGGTPPNLTYTPSLNYNGTDSFTFLVNDGHVNSEPALVNIEVKPNQAPTAEPQSLSTPEDTPLDIVLTGSDPDGDPLTFAIVLTPTHAILGGAAPNLSYTPSLNYNGVDSFTFVVNDGYVNSEPTTVDIEVMPINDAPTADLKSMSTPEDTPLEIVLTGSDPDGDLLTFAIVLTPTHGILGGAAPNLSYTPTVNYNGTDSFIFLVNDGHINSEPALVDIEVMPINDAPTADLKSMSTPEDIPLDIVLTGSDPDTDPLSFTVVSTPTHGILGGVAPNLSYTPTVNYNGTDSFTFLVNDGHVNSELALVYIEVMPVNDGPVANPQAFTTRQTLPVMVTLSGSDIDGDNLTYRVVIPPNHGTLSGTAPSLSYTPEPGYAGLDSFSFVTNDGELDSVEAEVSITINYSLYVPVILR